MAARASIRIANEIRPGKELTCSVVVVKQIHVKWTATLERQNPVDLPTITEPRMTPSKIWNVVAKTQNESVAIVEVGVALFQMQARFGRGLFFSTWSELPPRLSSKRLDNQTTYVRVSSLAHS